MEQLPTLPSGKIDRKALPAAGTANRRKEQLVAPRTPMEEQLVAIWSDVLRREAVGVHDNFFEIGGDSILSLQIVARAQRAGIRLTPRQLFQHQTVAELATVAQGAAVSTGATCAEDGEVPLLPIQRWFFEQKLCDRHHWNQSMLLELSTPPKLELLESALRHVFGHHDAFRLHFSQTSDGWRQEYAPGPVQTPFDVIDLSGVPQGAEAASIAAAAGPVHAGFDLLHGPLVRAAYFDFGPHRAGRLLLAAHHLVVDGVSWRVLLEDLDLAYGQLLAGQPVRLPAKTASLKLWSQRLVQYARSPAAQAAVSYWVNLQRSVAATLPPDAETRGENLESTAASLITTLPEVETQHLVQRVPAVYHTQIDEILLAALALTMRRRTGRGLLELSVEGHGRHEQLEDIDVSRTVGWFTSLFPVCIDIGTLESPGDIIKTVKEQLRAIPAKGAAYGAVRYLTPEGQAARSLRGASLPEIAFNYLGQLDQILASESHLRFASESSGAPRSPAAPRVNAIDIDSMIVGGCLQTRWTFSRNLHRRETVAELANAYLGALCELIRHCLCAGAGGYTPADFALAGLSPRELAELLSELSGSK